jgi:hypothetical protein
MIGAADWHVCRSVAGLRIRQLLMSTMAAEDAMLATFARWLQPSTVFQLQRPQLRCAAAEDALPAGAPALPDQRAGPRGPALPDPPPLSRRGRTASCPPSSASCCAWCARTTCPAPAPGAWLRFLRGGDAVNLRRVADHNHQDVVTLALLLQRLVHEEQRERETLALVGQ